MLVNCAGIIRRVAEHDVAVFEDVLAINLTGTMRACTLARPKLKATGGAIVNTASVLSFLGGGLVPGYRREQGRRRAAHEVAGHRLCAGWHSRERDGAWLGGHTAHAGAARGPARNAAIMARTPLAGGRTPDDIAGAVVFLCSPAARFVTGADPAGRRRLPVA